MFNEKLIEILSEYPDGYRVRMEMLDIVDDSKKEQQTFNQEVTAVGVDHDKHIITIRGEI